MTVTGTNSVGLMWQTVSYAAVETVTVSVGASKNDFGSMIADKLSGKLNTSDSFKSKSLADMATDSDTGKTKAADGNEKGQVSFTDTRSVKKTVVQKADSKEAIKPEDIEIMDEEDVTALCQQAVEVIASLLNQFAEVLGVSPEELEDAFVQIDINVVQIVDTETVSKLVLNMNGAEDMSDMLFDGDMLASFNQLKEIVDRTLEEAGLTADAFKMLADSEEFTAYTAELSENGQMAEGLKDFIEAFKPEQKQPEKTGTGRQEITAKEKEIDVTYTRIETRQVTSQTGSMDKGSSFSDKADTEETRLSTKTTTRNSISVHTEGVEGFLDRLQNVVQEAAVSEAALDAGVSVRDIVYQLVDAIKVNISNDNTSLELQLNPESLGKVQLNISSKDGVMTAHITTENETARQAVESQLQILKDTITEQGLKVDAIEVTVSDFSFANSTNAGGQNQEETGSKAGHSHRDEKSVGTGQIADETETLAREVMIQTGSTVNYVA